jgi:purine-nucleoside/S-methyl-5'-thioadenosine phosphorylase / adenosine deaminase
MAADPALPAGFAWVAGHIAIDLGAARVRFTTRRGGVSTGPYASLNLGGSTDDDPGAVRANHATVAAALGYDPDTRAWARQVHGTDVQRRLATPAPGEAPVDADGQATALTGVAVTVMAADCLPVALVAPGAVAMLHGGWRGLAGGVLEQGVDALRELGADGDIVAAIGPGAGPCCYEAGPEVHAALGHGIGRNVDLKAAARDRLLRAGVATVHDVDLCTICAPEELFFSHRRDRGVTGRQAGIAWRS